MQKKTVFQFFNIFVNFALNIITTILLSCLEIKRSWKNPGILEKKKTFEDFRFFFFVFLFQNFIKLQTKISRKVN